MEALPRLPMVSFDLLTTSEKVSFGQKLKLYIASFYQEDPESYNNEIRALESLRATAVWPSTDVNSCQIMKKYYCQLHYLKSRFPMEENQIASVFFAWKDEYTKMSCSVPDINFELMCMLINIGCIHSKLGAEDARTTPEGMKMSCTHFQCAAWAFQTVRETYGQLIGLVLISSEQIRGMQLMCLAEAQECILEKSLLDNRKATIIAKIAVQLCDYYRQAWLAFQSGDDCVVLDHLPNHKYLAQYLQFKIAYHRCIALLYQGQQAEEQQKMGERVAFYQAAVQALDDAVKQGSKMSNSTQTLFKDTIAFTLDVVKGKHKAAVNENEFIYHEDVPQMASLHEIKGASLVKGIPFNVHDQEVAGADIFGRLVPMEAHEASSLYSEKKAQLLRNVGERIERRDMELCDFLNSMQLEALSFVKQSKGLPQELVDRAAAMVAKPNATRDLIEAMGKLSDSYQEVESMLKEIQELLRVEETSEREYQTIMGKRPPSIIATDLAREAAKYQEAHGKASESNLNLHKAMTTHVANLKLLAQPLSQLVQIIPTLQLPDANVDEQLLAHMEQLMAKVDEMKNQRMMLWNQFREAVHQDDITGAIVTKESDQPLEAVFQQALDKHSKITGLLDQNLAAQENICKAFVEAYAKFAPTRKYLQDLYHKRNSTLSALIGSHDSYDDLLAKANKGIEFYAKLETNVEKLLGRIKSACNVQQEERDQMLLKNGHTKQHATQEEENNVPHVSAHVEVVDMVPSPSIVPQPQPSKPKLKDYLDSMKEKRDSQYPNLYSTTADNVTTVNVNWINDYNKQPSSTPANYQQPQYNNATNPMNTATNHTEKQYPDKNVNQELINKMQALKMNNSQYENPMTSYNSTSGYGYNPSLPTMSTAAYTHTVGATVAPAMASYMTSGYPSDATNNVDLYTDHYMHMQPPPVQPKSIQQEQPQSRITVEHPQVQVHQSTPYADQTYYNYDQPNPYYNYGQQPTVAQASAGQEQANPYYQYYNNTSAMPMDATQPTYAAVQPSQAYNTDSANYLPSANYPTNNTTYHAGYSAYTAPTGYTGGNPPVAATPTPPPAQPTPPPAAAVNPYTQPQSYYAAAPSPVTHTSADTNTNYLPANPISNYQYPSDNYSGTTAAYNNTTASDAYHGQTPMVAAGYPAFDGYAHQYSNGVANAYDYNNTTAGYNSTYQYPPAPVPVASTSVATATISDNTTNTTAHFQATNSERKESSIDLLAGLDFSINHAPLVPQKQTKPSPPPDVVEILPPTPTVTAKRSDTDLQSNKVEPVKKRDKILTKGNPFARSEIVRAFLVEVEKFEKYVEGLTTKTLNGPSNLEVRWKEIQECQDGMETAKKSISVARCYPLKNRSPDILPYDYSRVALVNAKDDYINASHVGGGPYCMDFIVTQLPLQHTVEEFWDMLWEQQIETVVCLLSDNEINEGRYWPSEPGMDLNVTSRRVILAHCAPGEHWTERKLTVSDEKESRLINIFQFTTWPGSLFPTQPGPYLAFLDAIAKSYERQKCSGAPVLVHCMAGVGRSGICCTLLAAIMEVAAVGCPLPDIAAVAARMSRERKNLLRDREHLKFVYTTLVQHLQNIRKGYTCDNEKSDDNNSVVKEQSSTSVVVDPLSELDPLWATRRS